MDAKELQDFMDKLKKGSSEYDQFMKMAKGMGYDFDEDEGSFKKSKRESTPTAEEDKLRRSLRQIQARQGHHTATVDTGAFSEASSIAGHIDGSGLIKSMIEAPQGALDQVASAISDFDDQIVVSNNAALAAVESNLKIIERLGEIEKTQERLVRSMSGMFAAMGAPQDVMSVIGGQAQPAAPAAAPAEQAAQPAATPEPRFQRSAAPQATGSKAPKAVQDLGTLSKSMKTHRLLDLQRKAKESGDFGAQSAISSAITAIEIGNGMIPEDAWDAIERHS